jgi:uncharacterized protein (DUF342 family)
MPIIKKENYNISMEQNKNGTAAPEGAARQSVLFGNRNDGNLSVTFSDADLEVHADFIPPFSNGQPLTAQIVASILEKINVHYGIRQDAINKALAECNNGRRQVKDVVIAKGDSPVNEVAEYFQQNPLLDQRNRESDPDSRIDYRSRSPFIIVKKDQALAKLKQRKPGKEGRNVHGDALPFSLIRPEGVSGGENTRTEGKLILANINGQLIEDKKILKVQETLVIKGGVDYTTGNIIFPGDVMIEGPVSDGFKICSGGSVLIKQTFDVTECVTKGDLVVAGGIIGRGAGLLKAGGGIKTKFIENCRVAARKAITVDSGIVNSSIFTLEHIEMGDKGIILGGDIYAVHGVRAGGIGKKAAKAARIHCGIDFTAQQEKEKNNNQLHILAAKLAKLREMFAAQELSPEQKTKLEELQRRLESEQAAASARVSELLGRVNTDENAMVEVSGEIAAGTLIEICQIALFVAEPLKKTRIRLDRAGGKLITESL